jgi:hypothetical protein
LKRKRGTRWLLKNGINLCEDHHVPWAHAEPEEFMDWWTNKVGIKTYVYVRMESLKIKPDLDVIEIELREALLWEI